MARSPSQLSEHWKKDKGFSHSPHGILLDRTLRPHYHVADHHIRDWMHCGPGDGIINTEVVTTNMLLRLPPSSYSKMWMGFRDMYV